MRVLTVEEIKQIELEIIVDIDLVCRRLGLNYSLAGGTLIGAIRHEGFIPWDDDIDIIMPRDDYEKLLQHYREECCKYRVASCDDDDNYMHLFAKISKRGTHLIEDNCNSEVELGVNIDVFPIDGLANTAMSALLRYIYFNCLCKLLVACDWKKFKRNVSCGLLSNSIRFLFFVISRLFRGPRLARRIEKKCRSIPYRKSKYAVNLASRYIARSIMDREEVYSRFIRLPFEGYKFSVLKDYDKYLRCIYGDYMQLPPADKRVSNHDFVAQIETEGIR